MARLMVVDDEPSMRDLLSIVLKKDGHEVRSTDDGREAIDAAARGDLDVVVQDLKMPKMPGIELLKRLREVRPDLPVVIITAFSTWDNAVEAMRLGAFDYIRKPFDNDNIRLVVGRAVAQREALEGGARDETPQPPMIGSSPEIRRVFDAIKRTAPTDATVLITGESGTGKELVARAIHYASLRSAMPFISINCGALPETLLESEMFGHKRGTFTGAVSDKPGIFQVADGGTLFLDEVGEMSPPLQVKFLRALEDRQFMPLGSTAPVRVDVRFVTATNRDLAAAVRAGKFREDLFYRLNVIEIRLPPLRERRSDIPLLAGHFIAKHAERMGRRVRGISAVARDRLMQYDWPGNVRELENVVQRAIAMTDGETIEFVDLPGGGGVTAGDVRDRLPGIGEGFDLEKVLADVERRYCEEALAKTGGNVTRAAALLGITFRAMRYKLRKYGMQGA